MEWLPVAGMIALLARSRRAFLLIGAWFAIFLVVKGTYVPASIEDASFWRILMPVVSGVSPAHRLRGSARPGVRSATWRRSRSRWRTLVRPSPLPQRSASSPSLPLGVIAATPVLKDGGRRSVMFDDNELPVSAGVGLTGERGQRRRAPVVARAEAEGGDDVFYRVLRAKSATDIGLRRNTGGRPVPALHGACRARRSRPRTTTNRGRDAGRTASACRRTGSTTGASATSTS